MRPVRKVRMRPAVPGHVPVAGVGVLRPVFGRVDTFFGAGGAHLIEPLDPEPNGPLVFFGLPDLLIVAAAAYDTWRHKRLHPAFLCGGLFVILSHPLRMLLAGTDLWKHFAAWVTA